jgi:tetratricopeptide (TPR) repeat protein
VGVPQPDKAARFFDHARAVHDTGNYEYAISLWLSGMRFDHVNVKALEGLWVSVMSFLQETGGKKSFSKETLKAISGSTDIDRYLGALMQWAQRPTEAVLAVRAAELAGKAKAGPCAGWVGERALRLALNDKRPRKDLVLKCSEALDVAGMPDKSLQAAEAALRLDPTDGALAASIRNLAAKAAMAKGGYEQAGQAGGFRQNIRDADKQRQLEEQDRVVKTEEVMDRLVNTAAEDYARRPDDPHAIQLYATRLIERRQPGDEDRALEVLEKGYQTTQKFGFRQQAGDVRIAQLRRRAGDVRRALEATPEDATLKARLEEANAALSALEIEEFRARVHAYPTDNALKFELGKRLFAAQNYDEAIPLFQTAATGDARIRASVYDYLARSFMAIGFVEEAISIYRQALEVRDVAPELNMELRYGLMDALMRRSDESRDLNAAEEADKIASAIAIQQFGYKDIRQRRETLKKLIAGLRGGGAASATPGTPGAGG